jgi:hypothetical protein
MRDRTPNFILWHPVILSKEGVMPFSDPRLSAADSMLFSVRVVPMLQIR